MTDHLESKIRAAHDAGDLAQAATLALEGYGPEILGYLAAISSNIDDAGETFSDFSEDLWRGLPEFRWQSTFRTWAYVLARHAMHRKNRGKRRHLPLSAAPISQIEQQVRDKTLAHLRTEVKDRFVALRASLPPDDQTLLVLRVDRDMSWDDIALVLNKKAPTLRKRFERVKERLRAMAEKEGLLTPQD
jgi:RNA polymerase sigma-70 factor (ECF subfamily)